MLCFLVTLTFVFACSRWKADYLEGQGDLLERMEKKMDTALFFPTRAGGLLDFKVDVVLARLEADFSDQPPSIAAMPNHQVSLQCPTNEYPCSTQPPSIPAVPNQ